MEFDTLRVLAVLLVLVLGSSSAARAQALPTGAVDPGVFPAVSFTKAELDEYQRRRSRQIASWTFFSVAVATLVSGVVATSVGVNAHETLLAQRPPIDVLGRTALLETAYTTRAVATVSFGLTLLSSILSIVFGTGVSCTHGEPGCL